MEAASFLFNVSSTSAGNSSLIEEFPYWQTTLALNLVSFIFVFASIHLLVYLPLLVLLAKMRSKNVHAKPLNVIHILLLASTIIEDILNMNLYVGYLPSMHRYCICSDILGTIFASMSFFTVYRRLMFASLGVLQLLVVLGKKRFLKVKVSCGVIAMCIGASLIQPASFLRDIYESNEKPICNTCYCPGYRPESIARFSVVAIVGIATTFVSIIPCLIVVFVTSTWSCAVFKQYYTGGDDQLNRRMLSLPIITPLVILASSTVDIVTVWLVGTSLVSLSLSEYFPHRIIFTHLELTAVLRVFTRLVYPTVLVYSHASLNQALKDLLKRFKVSNRVSPENSATSSQ